MEAPTTQDRGTGGAGRARIDGLDELIAALDRGERIEGGSPLHAAMHGASQHALRVTAELNGSYHEPARITALLSELTGRDVSPTVTVFPPLRADFGFNLRLGERVFVNSGCAFQDQGGITIGDDVLIGHNAVLATLDHDLAPERRADMHPAPIVIGDRAWLGANVTVLAGVRIGEGAVVAAGAVVTEDVPARTVVGGVPARVIREIDPQET